MSRMLTPRSAVRCAMLVGILVGLGGCATVQQIVVDQATDSYRPTALFVTASLGAVCIAGMLWRARQDMANRGIYLGILFGAAAQATVARRLVTEWRPVVLFGAAAVAIVLACIRFLVTRRSVGDTPPLASGLSAYMATLAALQAVDWWAGNT